MLWWIRISFDADQDLAFYHNAIQIRIRTQGEKPMQINADPDPCQPVTSQKIEFLHEKSGIGQKNIPTKVHKNIFERQEIRLIC